MREHLVPYGPVAPWISLEQFTEHGRGRAKEKTLFHQGVREAVRQDEGGGEGGGKIPSGLLLGLALPGGPWRGGGRRVQLFIPSFLLYIYI